MSQTSTSDGCSTVLAARLAALQVSGLSELGADDLQPLGQDDRSVYSLVGSVKSVDHNVCLAIADGLVSVLLAKSRQLPVVGGQFTGS